METKISTLSGLEPLLSIEELAEYLDVPVATIRDWRIDGKGPCANKVGGRVRFAPPTSWHGCSVGARRSRGADRAAGERRIGLADAGFENVDVCPSAAGRLMRFGAERSPCPASPLA